MSGQFIPNRLRDLRTRAGLTQAELAEKISSDASQVNSYETGEDIPSREAVIFLAEVLNTTVDHLVTNDGISRPATAASGVDWLTTNSPRSSPNLASSQAKQRDGLPSAPRRDVRASFTDQTITVYQAYSPQIADAAVESQTFVAPFKRDRMTWIKPSFLWMMYRSGWATKPGQERILEIQLTRDGFEWTLAHAALSSYEPGTYASRQHWAERKHTSPVRIQWDPDRSATLAPLNRRAIQIGLSGDAVDRYINQWITRITDVTPLAARVHRYVSSGRLDAAQEELPIEQVYPVPAPIRGLIGASEPQPGQLSS
ncbi:DUF4291 family protein [Amycolatopsis sp. WGS_07]|uniref:DUF4291 family protein n=1 Tax=Amycolatopsis sp. WGS_07 TaxID=3076764 RepID=UPI003872F494